MFAEISWVDSCTIAQCNAMQCTMPSVHDCTLHSAAQNIHCTVYCTAQYAVMPTKNMAIHSNSFHLNISAIQIKYFHFPMRNFTAVHCIPSSALYIRVFRKSLFVELDPVPKICDWYGELTKKLSAL